jgi:putative MATE family efflux protein
MNRLYEGNIRKNFFVYALPLVLTTLLTQAYSFINSAMAGYLIGDNAFAAIGCISPFSTLISSIYWGYGTGFCVYVAVLFGRGDYPKMLNVIKTNLLIGSAVIITISTLCIIFHENIYDFLNVEESMRAESFSYYWVHMASLFLLNISSSLVYISHALGLTKLPFISSCISNLILIAGNYILIKYAKLGVQGTAIATVISNLFAIIFYTTMLIRSFKKLGIKLGGFYINKDELKWSVHFAFPTMLQQSVMYLCTALVSPLTNLCGASAISGYTIGMRLYDLNAGVYQSSNKTVSNYIAQCVGAGKHSLIKKGIKVGLFQTLLFLAPFLIITVIGAEFIPKLFLDSSESIYYAKIFMRYCMPFVLFNVVNNMIHAIFRSSGAGNYLVISTVIYSIARFGYSYLLYGRFEMYGIYAAIVLSWITEAIFGIIIYLSGKWKNEEFRKLEKKAL